MSSDAEPAFTGMLRQQLAYEWEPFVADGFPAEVEVCAAVVAEPQGAPSGGENAFVCHQTGFYACRTAIDGSECHLEVRADTTARGFWHALEIIQGACEYALWLRLLHLGRGLILHACSVVAEGRSLAFSGREQAGKTSFARILSAAGSTVAHDESTLLTLEGDRVVTWSHPFRRRTFGPPPLEAQTAAVAFIEPGRGTDPQQLAAAEAVLALLYHSGVRSVRYLQDRGGDGRALEAHTAICSEIVARVPCYRWEYGLGDPLPELARQLLEPGPPRTREVTG